MQLVRNCSNCRSFSYRRLVSPDLAAFLLTARPVDSRAYFALVVEHFCLSGRNIVQEHLWW